jgi:hypothetical protein
VTVFNLRPKNVDGTRSPGFTEDTYNESAKGPCIISVLQYLPEGPATDGGYRKEALVQFVVNHGGVRTVAVGDILIH